MDNRQALCCVGGGHVGDAFPYRGADTSAASLETGPWPAKLSAICKAILLAGIRNSIQTNLPLFFYSILHGGQKWSFKRKKKESRVVKFTLFSEF